jgi:nucleoside-diphosphate-sugar epimerase
MRVVLGAGFTGSRVAELAARRGEEVVAAVRSEARARALEGRGFAVTREPVLDLAARVSGDETDFVICFPPDGATDAALAPLLTHARSVSYVSTTGVYGDAEGIIDDATPVTSTPTPAQARVLSAEAAYRAVRGTVLRAPGIYGPDRGLHVRVVAGAHRLPGEARSFISRIHADDLAALLLAASTVRGETFVVGDLEPAAHGEVVAWICNEHGCAMPPTVPPEEVHETLRRNRRVDPRRALRVLGVTLRYPSFRLGMKRQP